MRISAPALVLALACLLPAAALIRSQAAQTTSTVWDGVYTADQAARGANAFSKSCASCHGDDLGGIDEAPELLGGRFISDFDTLTVGDLFDRTRTSMPQNSPNSLSPETYADILAYLFKANGFPAGDKELDHRSAYLKTILFVAKNPHPGAPAPASPPQGGAEGGRGRGGQP